MILNTYHTPIWIVQSLSNDACSNCILMFSAPFFPGNWPIMKRHCSSLRFGRPANQLVFRYPKTPKKHRLESQIDWMLIQFSDFNPFQKKNKLDHISPSFRANEHIMFVNPPSYENNVWKHMILQPPHLPKTSWNNIPGFLLYIQYLQLKSELRLPNATLLVQSPNGTDAVLLGDELLHARGRVW